MRAVQRKFRNRPLAHAEHFKEIAAIVRPDRSGGYTYAFDQVRLVKAGDDGTDSLLALREGQFHSAGRRKHGSPDHLLTPEATSVIVSLITEPATRFPARSRESNVPASVHQPERNEKVMVPSRM